MPIAERKKSKTTKFDISESDAFFAHISNDHGIGAGLQGYTVAPFSKYIIDLAEKIKTETPDCTKTIDALRPALSSIVTTNEQSINVIRNEPTWDWQRVNTNLNSVLKSSAEEFAWSFADNIFVTDNLKNVYTGQTNFLEYKRPVLDILVVQDSKLE